MRMWRFVTTLFLWERYQFASQNKPVLDRLFLKVRFWNFNLYEGCCWRYRHTGVCPCIVSRTFWSTKHSTKVEIYLPSDTEWHPKRRQPYNKVRMNVSLIWRPQVLWYKEPTRCNNNNFINNFNQLNMFRPIISPILRSTRLCCGIMHRRCCLLATSSTSSWSPADSIICALYHKL